MKFFIPLIFVMAYLCPAQSFEVASIRPSAKSFLEALSSGANVLPQVAGDRFHAGPVPLRALITWAYDIKDNQFVGPEWMSSPGATSFEVDATLPEGTTRAQSLAMLQSLLAERFHLVARRSTKNQDGYAVTVARAGPRFEHDATPAPNGARSTKIGRAKLTFGAGGAATVETSSIAGLIDYLSMQLAPSVVVDRTGIQGDFDIRMELPPPDPAAIREGRETGADRMRRALDKLGLRLEDTTAPVSVVIVESVAQMPTGN